MHLPASYRIARSLLTIVGAATLVSLMLLFWPNWLNQALQTDGFAPHGACLLWASGVLSLFVGADTLIALSYFAISATLGYLVYRARHDIPFQWMFMAFGVFIVACGTTHLMDVVTIWRPVYWLSSGVKVVTAVASVATAITLPPLIPRVLRMAAAARLSEERRLQLEQAHQELSRLYAESQELDQLKTTFFANVSHELRTPLTLILAPTRALMHTDMPPPAQEHLAIIERNATHLLTLVNDLLDLAKYDAGHLSLHPTMSDLADLIRGVAAVFAPLAAERHVQVTLDLPAALPLAMDAEKMQRVLTNLLANALTWTPAGGRIACAATGDAAQVLIHVDDSGPGIPEESRAQIFERFLQVSGGGPRIASGTGLGLAITKELVAAHHGTISVTTAPLGGARFTIMLPRIAPDHTVAQAAPVRTVAPRLPLLVTPGDPAAESSHSRHAPGALPVILVVEDNPDMQRVLVQILSPIYHVLSAYDGAQGLALASDHQPDLVLTDLMMPGMSGQALIAALREHARLAAVPVIVLSANAEDDARVSLLRQGATDYLIKPFSGEELHARVANLIGLKQAREALQTRDHFLQMAAHTLRTPVTSLLGYAGLLERQIMKRCSSEALVLTRATATIQAQGQRLVRVINTLVDFLQIEQQTVSMTWAPVDLSAVIATVGAEMQALTNQHTIVWEPAAPPVVLTGDRHRLETVLSHILQNAIQFSPAGGIITITAAADEGQVAIHVADPGIGIPHGEVAHVMRLFYRASNADTITVSGMGIGLYVARGLITVHGGSVHIATEEGHGTVVTILLPTQGQHVGPHQSRAV